MTIPKTSYILTFFFGIPFQLETRLLCKYLSSISAYIDISSSFPTNILSLLIVVYIVNGSAV